MQEEKDILVLGNYCVQADCLAFYDLQRFAAEDEGRTELPSERRRREERQRGNVIRSGEIVSAAVLLGGVLALFLGGVYMFALTHKVFSTYFQRDFREVQSFLATMESIQSIMLSMAFETGKIVFPVIGAAFVMAIVGNVSQFGLLLSAYPLSMRWEKIKPEFRRIIPGKRTFFNLARVLMQLLLISAAAYIIISKDYASMLKTANMGLGSAILLFLQVALKLLVVAGLIFALVAVPDFFYQRYEYLEKLKIPISEAKRERKEEEGDPLIRQRQRDRAYELRKQRNMLQELPAADVLVTNPTHFAVALRYQSHIDQAPVVIGKGKDHFAFVMRKIAQAHSILIEENPPLARSLYEEVEIGQEIPATLYSVVSLIFAKLDRFRNRAQ